MVHEQAGGETNAAWKLWQASIGDLQHISLACWSQALLATEDTYSFENYP